MDEDVLPHPSRGVLLSAVCDSGNADSYRDYFEDVSKCVPYSSSSYSSSSGDSWESDEEEEDDDGVFLRITKAYEQQNNKRNEKPAVHIQFVNIHDVIDAHSPNEYAQTAQRIERVKARCKEKRIGLVFCMVSPMREEEEKKDHENKEDVTYALEERVLQVLKRFCGVETRIVALTRVGSDSREKCLKALARATEEVKQKVLVNEGKRAIGKCDDVLLAFEREVLESGGAVEEREVSLARLEARCKASRYLFKAASYAEFRGDSEAAMNALGECYASLMVYVDEAMPEVLRGSFEENNNTQSRRLWRVCETLRVLTYCRSRMSSTQLSQILKTMDTNANSEVNKAIQELARVEKEHACFR